MPQYRALVSLWVCLVLGAGLASAQSEKPTSPFQPLSNDQAWQQLPREEPPLPVWARVLAKSLPRTTFAMLRLDHLHRNESPLQPVLKGKLFYVAARANDCDYSRRYAEADLREAGLKDDEIRKLDGDWSDLSEKERATLTFAKKMTEAAYTVTDEEVANLVKHYDNATVVAMVHTLAYANFRDRILLALGVELEENGPVPALDLKMGNQKVNAPERPPWKDLKSIDTPVDKVHLNWEKHGFGELRQALERQKNRQPRIAPPGKGGQRIVWSQVSMGYAPKLTQAWFETMGTFQSEAGMDRVFSNLMFWVITRSNECFY